MNITKKLYIDIHKYTLLLAIAVYVAGVFTPLQTLQPGLVFVFGAGFFNLFHSKYFTGRLKLAAHTWLVPLLMASLTYSLPIQKSAGGHLFAHWLVVVVISALPFFLLITGKTDRKPSRKPRPRIVSARIIVQTILFMVYITVTAVALILGKRADFAYWAAFHISTTAILPFLFGRVLCSWICPNATLQDGLIKHLNYKRPIPRLPKAIEEQSRATSMNLSGEVDKSAPLMPATLLFCWAPMFIAETVFDLTPVIWYPVVFMYGLFILSFILPWRKMCTHFCWLSSYRGLAAHGSLWRLRYDSSKCKDCKRCPAERDCPFFIDIRNQDNEMPATCSVCFSCKESCVGEGVLTFRRTPSEKQRLKSLGL